MVQAPIVEVQLLGSFQLRDGSGAPVRLPTRKAEALLALLALRLGEPQSRTKLCTLLWPEVAAAQARHSLRQTLLQLRKALPPEPALLLSAADGLQLSASLVRVDVAAMMAGVAAGTREALNEAVQCYRGDLLEGLAVGEAGFDDWLAHERFRLRALLTQALMRLVELDSKAERYDDALRACTRLLELDRLHEEAQRSMIRLLARQGRRAAALQQYRLFASQLQLQLGSAPDPLTQRLFAELESAPAEPEIAVAALPPPEAAATWGRARELELLFEALSSAARGQARVTLLVGEAGVGKTHLCDRVALAAEARGFRVLRARSFESEQVLPLTLWANLLRDAITPELTLSPEQRAELATLVPALAEPDQRRSSDARQLFHAVHELVTRLASSAPLLLLAEDVHWADEMSARLLSYLGRHQRQARCLLLVSAREEDMPESAFIRAALAELTREQVLERVELAPLGPSETQALSSELVQRHALPPLGAAMHEQIWAISEGNPLVIVESVRALAQGVLAGEVTQLPIPERVRALILSRIARVSASAREVLALAAVAGRELELDVLMSALAGTPLSAALDELARAQLVRAVEERVYFTHDRIRETLYGELLPVSRRLLHGRVARALELRAEQLPAALGHIGYHYSKAGEAAAAVRYLVRFAAKAFRDHGVHEALVALERAFEDSARLPESERDKTAAEILVAQGPCLIALGRFDALVVRLRALAPRVELLPEPALAGSFHFYWGFALALMAERREAEAHAQRALALAERCHDARLTGYAHALLAYLCQMTGRYRAGVAHGELATQLLDACHANPDTAAVAWLSLGMNRLWLGEVHAALEAAEKAAAIARAADSLRGQALAATAAGCAYAYSEQWELAVEATQRGIAASKEPLTLVSAMWIAAWAQSGHGQTEPAIELLTLVIDQLAGHGMRAWSAHAMTILADAALRAGDAARALQVAREAFEVATETDDRACAAWALRAQGQAETALGQLSAARTSLDDALRSFEALEAPLDCAKCLLERGALLVSERRHDEARHDLRRARALFAACGVQEPVQLRARLTAATGGSGDSALREA